MGAALVILSQFIPEDAKDWERSSRNDITHGFMKLKK